MIVTCGDCGASFNLNDSLIKPTGTKVRCSKCQSVFVVAPPAEEAPIELVSQADEPIQESVGYARAAAEVPGAEDVEAKLNDFFGDEAADADMSELGELTDLDFESAELSADLPAGEDGGDFSLDLEPSAEDLLADLDSSEPGLTAEADRSLSDVAGRDDVLPPDDVEDLDLDLAGVEGENGQPDVDALPEIDDLLDISEEELALDSEELDALDDQLAADDAGLEEDIKEAVDLETHQAAGAAPAADDLDLDLDLDLEDGGLESAESIGADEALSMDLEDARDVPGIAGAAAASADADIDEIDLSDIEEMLGDEDLAAPDAIADAAEGIEELDLSDFALEPAGEDAGSGAVEAGGEDLELDLDLGLDEEPAAEPVAAAGNAVTDELDFSDLADVLEPGKANQEVTAGADDIGLDLDLDLGDSMAAEATGGGGLELADDGAVDLDSMLDQRDAAGAEEELDLTLEFDGIAEDSQPTSDVQPELEFDLEAELDQHTAGFDKEDELELNLLDNDEVTGEFGGAAVATAAATAGITTGVQEIGATTDDFATEEFTDARNLTGDTDLMMAEEADLPPMVAKPGRSRKPLIYALSALVVLAGALIVPKLLGIHIPVLSDVKIPYLSDWLGGDDATDPGNLKIIPLGKTINAKYVDNQQAGKLLVVSGQVRNEYKHPRSFIQLTGKVFARDGTVAKSITVYAGNMLSTLDLSRLDYAKIQDQLQNKSGQRKSNLNVRQGRVVPFMIVFDQLPIDLEEYTVEVTGSARE